VEFVQLRNLPEKSLVLNNSTKDFLIGQVSPRTSGLVD